MNETNKKNKLTDKEKTDSVDDKPTVIESTEDMAKLSADLEQSGLLKSSNRSLEVRIFALEAEVRLLRNLIAHAINIKDPASVLKG